MSEDVEEENDNEFSGYADDLEDSEVGGD